MVVNFVSIMKVFVLQQLDIIIIVIVQGIHEVHDKHK